MNLCILYKFRSIVHLYIISYIFYLFAFFLKELLNFSFIMTIKISQLLHPKEYSNFFNFFYTLF